MIKKIRHMITGEIDSKDRLKFLTFFGAELNFEEDVAKIFAEEVKERIHYDKTCKYNPDYYSGKKDIATFFVDNKIIPHMNPNYFGGDKIWSFKKQDDDKTFTYKIKSFPRRMKVKITAEVNGKANLEEMINLEALDAFLRTGKHNYTNIWGQKIFLNNKS